MQLYVLRTILAQAANRTSLKELVFQSSFDPRIVAKAAASIRQTLAHDHSLLSVALVGLDRHLIQTKTRIDPAFGDQRVMCFQRKDEKTKGLTD